MYIQFIEFGNLRKFNLGHEISIHIRDDFVITEDFNTQINNIIDVMHMIYAIRERPLNEENKINLSGLKIFTLESIIEIVKCWAGKVAISWPNSKDPSRIIPLEYNTDIQAGKRRNTGPCAEYTAVSFSLFY